MPTSQHGVMDLDGKSMTNLWIQFNGNIYIDTHT